MIQIQETVIKVERTHIVRQENIARRTNKIREYLKLLSMYLQNNDLHEYFSIIENQMHPQFVLNQDFWLSITKIKFEKENTQKIHKDIQFCMLGMQDGLYYRLAKMISEKIVSLSKEKQLRLKFCESKLEKFISFFEDQIEKGAFFFKKLRQLYEVKSDIKQIRKTFHRQIQNGFNDFDIVYDEYAHFWEKDKTINFEQIYQNAKNKWNERIEAADEFQWSVKLSKKELFKLENENTSKINEKAYLYWIEKLQRQEDKLWFLRRIALNYRQLMFQYCKKVQNVHRQDDQLIKSTYKIAIRLAPQPFPIEINYLYFLIKRISPHLTNEKQSKQYFDNWGNSVMLLRGQIKEFIDKDRQFQQQEKASISTKLYELWIEVEQNVVKDKNAVCQIYQKIIKQTANLAKYEQYAYALIHIGAINEAKNVLRRFMHHDKGQNPKSLFKKFIGIYGTLEDELQYDQQMNLSNQKDLQSSIKAENIVLKELETKPMSMKRIDIVSEVEQIIPRQQSKPKEEKQLTVIGEARKRSKPDSTTHDEVESIIEDKIRKKLHIDQGATVFLKGIPTDWQESDVMGTIVNKEKVSRVTLVVKRDQQKDYCYIEFDSTEAAEKEIQQNKSGYRLQISKPPADYDESKTLFVCALPHSATEEKIIQLFVNHKQNITQVRLKIDKQKNYSYVDFIDAEKREEAYRQVRRSNCLIDGKKIIIQHCDSSRMRNKKLIPVVFLKNLAFKAKENDVRNFFGNKGIAQIQIPKGENNRPKGFAYVEFEKFKDYQEALDMKKGSILDRQFLILKSDRQITHSSHKKQATHDLHNHTEVHKSQHHDKKHKQSGSNKNRQEKVSKAANNEFFSSLFK